MAHAQLDLLLVERAKKEMWHELVPVLKLAFTSALETFGHAVENELEQLRRRVDQLCDGGAGPSARRADDSVGLTDFEVFISSFQAKIATLRYDVEVIKEKSASQREEVTAMQEMTSNGNSKRRRKIDRKFWRSRARLRRIFQREQLIEAAACSTANGLYVFTVDL